MRVGDEGRPRSIFVPSCIHNAHTYVLPPILGYDIPIASVATVGPLANVNCH